MSAESLPRLPRISICKCGLVPSFNCSCKLQLLRMLKLSVKAAPAGAQQDQRCEAEFFLGEYALLKRNRDEAISRLQTAVQTLLPRIQRERSIEGGIEALDLMRVRHESLPALRKMFSQKKPF